MRKQVNSGPQVHKVGFYIRVSTEEQADSPEGSIRNQEERLKTTLKLKNMDGPFGELVHVYIDRARSGKDTNRPELQKLLKAIQSREITLVMVSELSRLTRSIKDFSQIKEMMDACGCGMVSLRESFDSTTAAGEMVMYLMANLAQFERRQVGERVSANFQARAERGLYNGGVLPLGYKLIPEKPGYLAVDEEQAEVVKACFQAFLSEGTLSASARWLNRSGYAIKREKQGGGYRPRLGHFTVENLYRILTNQAYVGIRAYRVKNEWRETKALWPALVDQVTFEKVGKQLKANHCRKKPETYQRFPFLLSGKVSCGACKERMVGKSAHGNSGKVPYYEHGWATKRDGCLLKPAFTCEPFRVQAKKLEPAVWDEVARILAEPKLANDIILAAEKIHHENSKNSEETRIQSRIDTLRSQIEVLAERLSILPKSVSPDPIYRQMEKLEAMKAEEEKRRLGWQGGGKVLDKPTELTSYQALLSGLNTLRIKDEASRTKFIQTLIHEVQVTRDGFKIHYYAGKSHVESARVRLAASGGVASDILLSHGSNSLINGGSYRD